MIYNGNSGVQFGFSSNQRTAPVQFMLFTLQTELNSTSETKSCQSRAKVEPAQHGSSTTFETGLIILVAEGFGEPSQSVGNLKFVHIPPRCTFLFIQPVLGIRVYQAYEASSNSVIFLNPESRNFLCRNFYIRKHQSKFNLKTLFREMPPQIKNTAFLAYVPLLLMLIYRGLFTGTVMKATIRVIKKR